MRMKWVLLGQLFGLLVWGGIDIKTTINNLQLGGDRERCGLIQLWINSDDFRDATPSNPNYIRIRFDKNAKLAETLVDHIGSETGHLPIALPAGFKSSTNSVINIPATGITIVRWRSGEGSIWLKFTASSSFWVTRNGVPGPPTPAEPVVITLGQTIEETVASNTDDFNNGRINLISPARFSAEPVDIPTLVDLRESNLQPAPLPDSLSLLTISAVALASDTTGVENGLDEPVMGSLIFIVFTGDTEIGRGVGFRIDRWLYHIPRDGGGFQSQFLFSNRDTRPALMRLRPYDSDGQALEDALIDVDEQGLRIVSKNDVFGSLAVSHVQILGSERCLVGIAYRSESAESLTAHTPENRKLVSFWELFPETASFAFDGFALVNFGSNPATITVESLDANGNEISSLVLFETQPFLPNSKKLVLLSDVIQTETMPAVVRFKSSERLGVVALRGSLPGQIPASLFPVPIFTNVFIE